MQKFPVDAPKVRRPDISRAKDMLGWEPKVGLERTVEYFEELRLNIILLEQRVKCTISLLDQ